MSYLAQLRGILHRTPSEDAWEALYVALDKHPAQDLDIALDYAREHLETWPDTLRVAPYTWRGRPSLLALSRSTGLVHVGLDLLVEFGEIGVTTQVASGAWYAGKIVLFDQISAKDPTSMLRILEKLEPYRGYGDMGPYRISRPPGSLRAIVLRSVRVEAHSGHLFLEKPTGAPYSDWGAAQDLVVLSAVRTRCSQEKVWDGVRP